MKTQLIPLLLVLLALPPTVVLGGPCTLIDVTSNVRYSLASRSVIRINALGTVPSASPGGQPQPYSAIATGTLVNNTNCNGRALVLPVAHILDDNKDGVISTAELGTLNTWKFRFNYRTGATHTEVTGATLLAKGDYQRVPLAGGTTRPVYRIQYTSGVHASGTSGAPSNHEGFNIMIAAHGRPSVVCSTIDALNTCPCRQDRSTVRVWYAPACHSSITSLYNVWRRKCNA